MRNATRPAIPALRLAGLALLGAVCPVILAVGLSVPGSAAGAQSATATATVAATLAPAKFAPLAEPKLGKFDPASVAKIDLKSYPVLPEIQPVIRAIYQEGLRRGNNPKVFSKIGDCMTATPNFLEGIAKGDYNLDTYGSLQAVIDYFAKTPARKDAEFDSFANPGLAASSGYNVAGVLDSTWSDPKWCSADETPLACEYRASKPMIALIMFGTNDLRSLKPEQFEFYLRRVIVQTYNAGIIPVIYTFPVQASQLDNSILFNKITVKVATEYNLPLINLWLAFEPLPNKGIDSKEPTHMTRPESGKTFSFAAVDLQQGGYNVRNLLTLQTLEAILRMVAPEALKPAK